jgi:hypothetical protein
MRSKPWVRVAPKIGMALGCWCVLSGTAVLAAGLEGPVRPEAMRVVPYAPPVWADMDVRGAEYRRLEGHRDEGHRDGPRQ